MGYRDTTLTIANGGTLSEELSLQPNGARRRVTLLIISPNTLAESVTVRVRRVVAAGTTLAGTLQSGGTDIVLPAGKATLIDPLTAASIQLVAGGAVGAERVFQVLGAAMELGR